MSPTAKFVAKLLNLGEGELTLLREHAFASADESVLAFDVFTGLWWPLREESPRAPRREASWLVLKLYAFRPLAHQQDNTFAILLRRWMLVDPEKRKAWAEQMMNAIITSPLEVLEPHLKVALREFPRSEGIDWITLLDDLSFWESRDRRNRWLKEFFQERR